MKNDFSIQQNNFLKLLAMALACQSETDNCVPELCCAGDAGLPNRDWDEMLRLAREQAVAGMVAQTACTCLARSSEFVAAWETEYFNQVKKYSAILSEQVELHRLMAENDISYAVLKGCAAAVYYPESVIRTMGDIDIIVAPEQFEAAFELMKNNGYETAVDKAGSVAHLNRRHACFSKNGISFELHRIFADGRLEWCEEFNELIFENLRTGEPAAVDEAAARGIVRSQEASDDCTGELNSTEVRGVVNSNIGGNCVFCRLNDMVNGLVLLQHINQHIRGGLGLRQFIDWMMFVKYSGVEAGEFLALSERFGLKTLAVHASMLCKLYLESCRNTGDAESGRHTGDVEPERHTGDAVSSDQNTVSRCISDEWCVGADEDVCREMMHRIFRDGNFGHKDATAASIRSIMNGNRNPVAYIKRLQLGGLCRWSAAQSHPVLRPFAWLYQLGRVIPQMLRRDDAIGSIKQDMETADQEREMLKKLGLL